MSDFELTMMALAEMRAKGYGNYIPQCVRPILDKWLRDSGYQPVYECIAGVGNTIQTPSHLS